MIKNYFPVMVIIISIIIFIVSLKKGSRSRTEVLAYLSLLTGGLKTIRSNFWPCIILVFLPFMTYLNPGLYLGYQPPVLEEPVINFLENLYGTFQTVFYYPFETSFLGSLLFLPVFFWFFGVRYQFIFNLTDAHNHKLLKLIRIYCFLLFVIFLVAIPVYFDGIIYSASSNLPGFIAYQGALAAVLPVSVLFAVGFYTFLSNWNRQDLSTDQIGLLWNLVLSRYFIFIRYALLASLIVFLSYFVSSIATLTLLPDFVDLIMEVYWYITLLLLPIYILLPFILCHSSAGLLEAFKSSLRIIKANFIGMLLIIMVPVLILTLISIGWDAFEYYVANKNIVLVMDILSSIVFNFIFVLFFLSVGQIYSKEQRVGE